MRSASAGVALTAVACSAFLACDTGQEPAPPVAAVVVAPATVSLPSLGDTVRLTARATDTRGKAMTGAPCTWSSTARGTASVSNSGLVTAVANGVATITATSAGVVGSAQVTVAQQVASITVTPATASLDALGTTVQLTAGARDANGHPIAGVTYSWATSNPGVASVDASGLVTAVGSGSVNVTATASGRSGTVAVRR